MPSTEWSIMYNSIYYIMKMERKMENGMYIAILGHQWQSKILIWIHGSH